MFVRPQFRGLGIGSSVLVALEEASASLGVHVLFLETGDRAARGAHALCVHGYRRRAHYGEYRDDPSSVFMEKLI